MEKSRTSPDESAGFPWTANQANETYRSELYYSESNIKEMWDNDKLHTGAEMITEAELYWQKPLDLLSLLRSPSCLPVVLFIGLFICQQDYATWWRDGGWARGGFNYLLN